MFRMPLREAKKLLGYEPFYFKWGRATPLCKDCAYCMTDKQEMLDYFKTHPSFRSMKVRLEQGIHMEKTLGDVPARRCSIGAFAVNDEGRCGRAKPKPEM